MKKFILFLLTAGIVFTLGAGTLQAADKTYRYAEEGFSGELKLADTPEGWFLTITTLNKARGHTCDLDNYECVLKGKQYYCQPHEGGDPDPVPLVIKIQPDKSIRVSAAQKNQSIDSGEFCGMGGAMSGLYKPAR